jgi:integrase
MPLITKRMVDRLHPGDLQHPGREAIIFDEKIIGFGIRMQPSGVRTYVFQYRAGSGRAAPRRRMTLARVGAVSLEEARRLAEQARADVAHGRDPAKEKADRRNAETFGQLAEMFLEHIRIKRKPATAAHYRGILGNHVLPVFDKRKAREIGTADVSKLHAQLKATPYIANQVLAIVGSMYSYARKEKILPPTFLNPARDIEKFTEEKKERFLSTDEIRRLAAALREAETVGIPSVADESKRVKFGAHACAAIRLLMFTGARLREILHLKWEHVDLTNRLLLLPDSKTGKKTIVLSDPAIAILSGLPRVGRYVIAGETAGMKNEKPRANLVSPWTAVCRRAGISGARIHDLRHSLASHAIRAGLGLPIIGKLLGHTQPQTTARYTHIDAGPLIQASNLIAARLMEAIGESGEITPPKH